MQIIMLFELFSIVRGTNQWQRWGNSLVKTAQVIGMVMLFIFAICLIINGIAAAIIQGDK